MSLEAIDRPAPHVRVEDEDGAVALADCWRDRAAVLIFLRHFG